MMGLAWKIILGGAPIILGVPDDEAPEGCFFWVLFFLRVSLQTEGPGPQGGPGPGPGPGPLPGPWPHMAPGSYACICT